MSKLLYKKLKTNYTFYAIVLHLLPLASLIYFSYSDNHKLYIATNITLVNSDKLNLDKQHKLKVKISPTSMTKSQLANQLTSSPGDSNQKYKIKDKIKTLSINKIDSILDSNINNSPIVYPYTARFQKQEGLLILLININQQGEVENIAIEKSTGFTILDKSAVKTVNHWKFKVSLLDYKNTLIRLPIQFLINNKPY